MPPIPDRAEAQRLVDTYSDLILRLSYTYLGSTADAQDICQTVFLKLLQAPRPLTVSSTSGPGSSAPPSTCAKTT
ncbi:sigma factor [Flavonifractor sp. AGMB03687]|uniref:RNA polymerase sigma factor n=1 Tax=Flavonifractor sp. AGMB03687 TaxID=2785133 RepID=UPI001FD79BA7|nr:sigma factor [Flavonifractor sp. AGMB03687]